MEAFSSPTSHSWPTCFAEYVEWILAMSVSLTPRVDAVSKLAPNLLANAKNQVAQADGLTETEAQELVTWLMESGYHEIEVVHDEDHCSVFWKK
jgi:hypothetical protein